MTTISVASLPFPEQQLLALQDANDIRFRRSVFKREIRTGERRLEDVLMDPEWFTRGIRICDLLSWAPRIGSWRVDRILRRADVWPLKSIDSLTTRQRLRIIAEIQR